MKGITSSGVNFRKINSDLSAPVSAANLDLSPQPNEEANDPLKNVKETMKNRGLLKFFLKSLQEDQWQTALD